MNTESKYGWIPLLLAVLTISHVLGITIEGEEDFSASGSGSDIDDEDYTDGMIDEGIVEYFTLASPSYLQRSDDGSSSPINVPGGFPFASTRFYTIYVNTNGIISMEFPFTSHSTQNFPIENKYLVAPFWSDVNTNRGGSIRYQVYFSGSSLHATIEENFNFNAQWMLVVEWDRVPEYGTSNTQTNTYQAVLATDGINSLALFIYKCGDLQWSGRATIGYSASTERFFNHWLSGTTDIACLNAPRNQYSTVLFELADGSLNLPMGMTVSVHNTDPLEFTLYCISTGGPVTTVIWTKDSVELEGGVTVLDSGRFSRYTHSLNATEEGMYNCTVSNNQTSSATAELNITVPSPPSNLSVSQTSFTSVVVSWTPSPHGANGYTVYYKLATVNGNLFSRHVQDHNHYVRLYLQIGKKYSISIVATNDVMNSTEIGPLNITLITALKTTVTSSREPPFYAGTALNLTCNVDLPDTVDPQIIADIKWSNNFINFPIYRYRSNVNVIGKTLNFHPLTREYELSATYSCKVRLRSQHYAVNHNESQSLNIEVTDLPPPEVEISEVNLPVIGTALTLECNVFVVPHLIKQPHVEMIAPKGVSVVSSGNSNGTLSFILDPVKAWNIGQYMCKGILEIEAANVHIPFQSTALFLSVQIPEPIVTISALPRYLTIGSTVTLTCEATLDPHVDTFGSISVLWGGPRIVMNYEPYSVIESGFKLKYTSSLTMSNLQLRDEGQYTCTVRVMGDRNVLGNVVTKSVALNMTARFLEIDVVSNTVEVTVGLPGADEITVILRDANNKRWTEHVSGSSGSVTFTDLPSGPTKVKAVNSGDAEVKEETEWFVVTVY